MRLLRDGARWLLREELAELHDMAVPGTDQTVVQKIEQPAPIPNTGPDIWPLVMADMKAWLNLPDSHALLIDMEARDRLGRQRYGTPLQAHNGRDALRDAYEEALDLCVYLRQAKEEGIEGVRAIYSNALCEMWNLSLLLRGPLFGGRP